MILIFFVIILIAFACKKEIDTDTQKWGFYVPDHFPEPVFNFQNDPQSYYRFDVGRDLFFDPILSLDNTISCATCHAQVHSFADHGAAFSAGVDGVLGTRNSPSIANMAWSPSFMWDGGVNHLEVFSVAPITNPLEMKETMANVVAKLNANATYRAKFKKAYNAHEINDQLLLRALTQYMMMIISDQSKYDKYVRGDVSFTSEEITGKNLFQAKCASCHTEPLFSNYAFINNGLDETFTDLGRGQITLDPADNGKFKVPSLRNVAMTYPYMHDGRFYSLEQVLDHYSNGIKNSSTLHPSLQNGIPMTEDEKKAIITFLKTLTDYELMENPFLREPKK